VVPTSGEHRHAGLLGQRRGGDQVAGGHIADQGEDLVVLDQAAVFSAVRGLVGVVERDQLQPAPVHAAGVDLLEGQQDAGLVVDAEILGRPAEDGRLAQPQAVVATPVSACAPRAHSRAARYAAPAPSDGPILARRFIQCSLNQQ
jgi:hypothetical protein